MTYQESLRGIALIIISALITIYGIVGGVSQISAHKYRDDVVFPVTLQSPQRELQTAIFTAGADETRSFWLRYPNRRLENKDLQFRLRVVDVNGKALAEWNQDFRAGYLRDSAGRWQYYKIGQQAFGAGFKGYFHYMTAGSWRPQSDGVLVLRDKGEGAVPFKYLAVIGVGVMILVIGFRQLPVAKSKL